MKNSIILILLLCPAVLFGQTDSSKKLVPTLKKMVSSVINKSVSPAPQQLSYRTIPTLHQLLDTASLETVYLFLGTLTDSVLRLIHTEGELILADFVSRHTTDPNDKDGDGNASTEAGGSDCNDFIPMIHRNATEYCSRNFIVPRDLRSIGNVLYSGPSVILFGALMDEDCNPCTIASILDGDRDGDGQISCRCSNVTFTTQRSVGCPPSQVQLLSPYSSFGLSNKYIVSGIDCDDANPVVIRGTQQCVFTDGGRVCENGAWKNFKCKTCVTQPNGTGTVIEW